MITTKNRDDFAKVCFKQGARLKPEISEMRSGDVFTIFTVGGLNTWKSLASDAMICGLVDCGNLNILRNEMMFESNNIVTDYPQDAQDKPLYKFFQINSKTVCIVFCSSNEFFESHIFEEKTMKKQIQDEYGLKDTDLHKLIIFQSLHDLHFYNDDRKQCPAERVVQVHCPEGIKSDTRALVFS